MRLINVRTRQLEEFFGDAIPEYAILSHTWGKDEVTFRDLEREDHRAKHGYAKIEGCCQQAARDGLAYVWVDTCCIDKSSSAELSEAINSMYQWYAASKLCYAYLEDVPPNEDPFPAETAFRKSRWFTRGWTLQELLAPNTTPVFLHNLFDNRGFNFQLFSEITGIHIDVLIHKTSVFAVSAACKFSWAAKRRTTRVEDMAYCLMGLLGVNMPLLYGEGEKSFTRLQEAVLNGSDDISMLSWGYTFADGKDQHASSSLVLARSPAGFLGHPTGNVSHYRRTPGVHTTMTGHGLHIELPIVRKWDQIWIVLIEEPTDNSTGLTIALRQQGGSNANLYRRAGGCPPIVLSAHCPMNFKSSGVAKMIYIQDTDVTPVKFIHPVHKPEFVGAYLRHKEKSVTHLSHEVVVLVAQVNNAGFFISSFYPPADMEVRQSTMGEHRSSIALVCYGRTDSGAFYATFSSTRGEGFALKIQSSSTKKDPHGKSVNVFLSSMTPGRNWTALEYCYADAIPRDSHGKLLEARWGESARMQQAAGHVRADPTPHIAHKGSRFWRLLWFEDFSTENRTSCA